MCNGNNPPSSSEIIIYVSRNGNSKQLKLRDSEGHNPSNDDLTTDVSPGNTIKWVLDSNSGLSSITQVKKVTPADPSYQPNAVTLLTSEPTSVNNEIIAAVVATSPGSGKFENYKIGFTIPGDSTEYWDDPRLKMR